MGLRRWLIALYFHSFLVIFGDAKDSKVNGFAFSQCALVFKKRFSQRFEESRKETEYWNEKNHLWTRNMALLRYSYLLIHPIHS